MRITRVVVFPTVVALTDAVEAVEAALVVVVLAVVGAAVVGAAVVLAAVVVFVVGAGVVVAFVVDAPVVGREIDAEPDVVGAIVGIDALDTTLVRLNLARGDGRDGSGPHDIMSSENPNTSDVISPSEL